MVRLTLIIFFFVCSLLSVFKAPFYYSWLLAIAVTEYALVFIFIMCILLISGIWVSQFRFVGNLLACIGLLLYLSPIIRAHFIGRNLTAQMDIALGTDKSKLKMLDNKPFSMAKLFSSSKVSNPKSFTYDDSRGVILDLDYYRSTMSGFRPCVVVIHGGSWRSGDNKQLPELNAELANAGYHVVAINYRLAPKYHTPAPVADVVSCLKYLREHKIALSIDTSKIILLGRSAGAQIALLAAYTLHDPSIIGVINFYGPADMVWGYAAPSNPLIMDSRKVMEDYIGGAYPVMPSKYEDCSPIRFVDHQSPPTLTIHGKNDVLVAYGHSERLERKLQQMNVKHFFLKLPWATHGFDYHINGPGGQLSTFSVRIFLEKITSI